MNNTPHNRLTSWVAASLALCQVVVYWQRCAAVGEPLALAGGGVEDIVAGLNTAVESINAYRWSGLNASTCNME